MRLELRLACDDKENVVQLFKEYINSLIAVNPFVENILATQNYEEELGNFEEKYALPDGRLYLAYGDGQAAGCVAIRKVDDQSCELKRLYVRPNFRGRYLGELLVRKVIDDAREIGYKYMLLDTLPFLESAIKMYQGLGFYKIERYNDNPEETAIYMRLDL